MHTPLRKRPEAELCRDLLGVLEGAGSAILAVAHDGTVVFANARAAELFASSFPGGFDPDARRYGVEQVLAPLELLLRGQDTPGRRPTLEARHDGVTRVFGYTIHAVPERQPELFAIVFSDVTAMHRLEEERARLLKLATVGEIMPMLLHETKNPLSAAATTLELLIEESVDGSVRQDLHAVLTEVRRAVLTLDGLGSVGRTMRTQRFYAIDHAVREVCALLEARALRHRIRLVVDVPDLPLVPLDPATIRSIVLNLVTNAIHACQEGGCTIEVRLGLEGDALRLDVTDRGVGMTPEVLAQCRELFFTTKRSGSGLGLALVHQLVEDAGGRLDIESAPHEGTRVAIVVPGMTRQSMPALCIGGRAA